MFIIDINELFNLIDNYWTDSNNMHSIIKNLDFSKIKSNNVDIEYIIKQIKNRLNKKYKEIIFYENITDEELYDKIINNKLILKNKNFYKFMIKIIRMRFQSNSEILIAYLSYCKHIQDIIYLYEEYSKINNKNNYIEYMDKKNNDYISEFHIDDSILKMYKTEAINKILKEYKNGLNFKRLIKKYHPDLNLDIDDEYIKIINSLREENIIK